MRERRGWGAMVRKRGFEIIIRGDEKGVMMELY